MKSIIFTVRPDEKTSIITVINGLKSYSGRCRVDFAANKIDIDDSIVFILDGGTAANLD